MIFVLGTSAGIADGIKVYDLVLASETVQYDCIS